MRLSESFGPKVEPTFWGANCCYSSSEVEELLRLLIRCVHKSECEKEVRGSYEITLRIHLQWGPQVSVQRRERRKS